ncbi:hypothetical protein AYI70_g11343 [Smittium culicis]|uniref:Zonadhesin n=1 Tax=Smittium culicis TaxID=133412 RepID=A0A1R1X282_9FUNG|nr:hypothetical protein AYI70_g11343 [Smittium culicis]
MKISISKLVTAAFSLDFIVLSVNGDWNKSDNYNKEYFGNQADTNNSYKNWNSNRYDLNFHNYDNGFKQNANPNLKEQKIASYKPYGEKEQNSINQKLEENKQNYNTIYTGSQEGKNIQNENLQYKVPDSRNDFGYNKIKRDYYDGNDGHYPNMGSRPDNFDSNILERPELIYSKVEPVTVTITSLVNIQTNEKPAETKFFTIINTQVITENKFLTITETDTQAIISSLLLTSIETVTGTITESESITVTETTTQSDSTTITETTTTTDSTTNTETDSTTITETKTESNSFTITETSTEVGSTTVTETTTESSSSTITQTTTEFGTLTDTESNTITETTTETNTTTLIEATTETNDITTTETTTESNSTTITETATESDTVTVTQSETVTESITITQTTTESLSVTVTVAPSDTVIQLT